MAGINKLRSCGCKGCRVCLLCETAFGINSKQFNLSGESYVYCPLCNKAWSGWNSYSHYEHPGHSGQSLSYDGVYIDTNFLSNNEESMLVKYIDKLPWNLSQSGRRKQNFGPKCNFKKRKLQLGDFKGFPLFSKFVQDKLQNVPVLNGFQTVEQCFLEYRPETGAAIDPHIDDCWIWGERIVTVNLLSDTVLTMTYNKLLNKYNLDCVEEYGLVGNTNITSHVLEPNYFEHEYPIVRIPLPRRSLLVLYGPARYKWEHQILREDISNRRLCIAYREFTPSYLPNGKNYEISKSILKNAKLFF